MHEVLRTRKDVRTLGIALAVIGVVLGIFGGDYVANGIIPVDGFGWVAAVFGAGLALFPFQPRVED